MSRTEFLAVGSRVGLRPLVSGDAGERYVAWLNDPEVVRFTESRGRSYDLRDVRAYIEKGAADSRVLLLAVVELDSLRHVGNVKVGPFDAVHGTASMGIIIGEKDCWGQGIGAEAVALAAGLAFRDMGVRKLTAGCIDLNGGSVRAFEKAGFEVECVRKRHNLCEGEFRHVVMLCLFAPAVEGS